MAPPDDVVVDDLRRDEVDGLEWSGSASHLSNVGRQLERRDAGVVDYLVVRDADGAAIAKAGIDYEEFDGVGSIIQVATRPDLEGRGLAQLLMHAAEERIRARGLTLARLAVEPDNARARRLYDHLGYEPVGQRETGWEYEDADGVLRWYRTDVIDMEKRL